MKASQMGEGRNDRQTVNVSRMESNFDSLTDEEWDTGRLKVERSGD